MDKKGISKSNGFGYVSTLHVHSLPGVHIDNIIICETGNGLKCMDINSGSEECVLARLIHPRFLPLLDFIIKPISLEAMPFRLNIAIRFFIKLSSVIIKELRFRGILIFALLDDWNIVLHRSNCVSRPSNQLASDSIRFHFYMEKSVFIPTQVIQWLGLMGISKRHNLSLPLAFKKKVRGSITKVIKCNFVTH